MNVTEINPLTLPTLLLSQSRNLPRCKAVYFVIDGETVLYIGQTINLANRFLTHHRIKQFGNNARVAWLECSDESLLPELEKALISYFKPLLNGTKIEEENRRYKLPTKISIYIPEGAYDKLNEWADSEGRPVSNLAAFIIESIVRQHSDKDFSLTVPKNNK